MAGRRRAGRQSSPAVTGSSRWHRCRAFGVYRVSPRVISRRARGPLADQPQCPSPARASFARSAGVRRRRVRHLTGFRPFAAPIAFASHITFTDRSLDIRPAVAGAMPCSAIIEVVRKVRTCRVLSWRSSAMPLLRVPLVRRRSVRPGLRGRGSDHGCCRQAHSRGRVRASAVAVRSSPLPVASVIPRQARPDGVPVTKRTAVPWPACQLGRRNLGAVPSAPDGHVGCRPLFADVHARNLTAQLAIRQRRLAGTAT